MGTGMNNAMNMLGDTGKKMQNTFGGSGAGQDGQGVSMLNRVSQIHLNRNTNCQF